MANSAYWYSPLDDLFAESEPTEYLESSAMNAALSKSQTFVDDFTDTWWSLGIPPLRQKQRNDSLGFTTGSPRLNTAGRGSATSVQETRAPRLPEGGQSYS
jgi:hypothetical protein